MCQSHRPCSDRNRKPTVTCYICDRQFCVFLMQALVAVSSHRQYSLCLHQLGNFPWEFGFPVRNTHTVTRTPHSIWLKSHKVKSIPTWIALFCRGVPVIVSARGASQPMDNLLSLSCCGCRWKTLLWHRATTLHRVHSRNAALICTSLHVRASMLISWTTRWTPEIGSSLIYFRTLNRRL